MRAHFTLVTLKDQCQGHSDLEGLYLVSFYSLQKICHTNCRCQAERQGPWTGIGLHLSFLWIEASFDIYLVQFPHLFPFPQHSCLLCPWCQSLQLLLPPNHVIIVFTLSFFLRQPLVSFSPTCPFHVLPSLTFFFHHATGQIVHFPRISATALFPDPLALT